MLCSGTGGRSRARRCGSSRTEKTSGESRSTRGTEDDPGCGTHTSDKDKTAELTQTFSMTKGYLVLPLFFTVTSLRPQGL